MTKTQRPFDVQKGVFEQRLQKATDPRDTSKLLHGIDFTGNAEVDHKPHTIAHPPEIQHKVDRFNRAISGENPMIRRTPARLAGISRKIVYDVSNAGDPSKKFRVLVKPYHEALDPRLDYWQKHKIQGWAEMANQALYHAADIGHLHQHVHTTEMDMGPGHENVPVLAIHMSPNIKMVADTTPEDFSHHDPSNVRSDASKIATMDFLTNNIDRNAGNLLVKPPNATDESGVREPGTLLAIDHGRSFQYHSAHKSPYHARAGGELDPLVDSLHHYLWYNPNANVALDRYFHQIGEPLIRDSNYVDFLEDWWPRVRDNISDEIHRQTWNLQDPKMRDHILNNFESRMALLDKIVADPNHYRQNWRTFEPFDVPVVQYNK